MAVDTAAKRFSLLGFGCPVPQMVVVPSGSVSTADRADLVYLYAGLSLSELTTPSVPGMEWTMADELLDWTLPGGRLDWVLRYGC